MKKIVFIVVMVASFIAISCGESEVERRQRLDAKSKWQAEQTEAKYQRQRDSLHLETERMLEAVKELKGE